MIKMATCFDRIGSLSGLHYETTIQKAVYIFWDPKKCMHLFEQLVHSEGLIMTQ
jgi:hypothetical protein